MTSTSKAVELQLQVKHNAEELQDFMRDLEHWEKTMRQKDLELRRQSGVPEEVSGGSLLVCSRTCLPLGCARTRCVHTNQQATVCECKSKADSLGLTLSCGLQDSNLSQQALQQAGWPAEPCYR